VAITRTDAIGQKAGYDSSGQAIADSVTADLKERHRKSKAARQQLEYRKWLLQLAYFGGNQWTSVDRTGRLYEPELDPYKLKLVDNRIQPAVIQQVAKMTKHRPVIVVVPNTADQGDIEGAKLAEEALDWAWAEFDLTRKRRQAILWSRVCSAGFWKICWDDRRATRSRSWTWKASREQVLLDGYGRPLPPTHPEAAAVLQNLDPGRGGDGQQPDPVPRGHRRPRPLAVLHLPGPPHPRGGTRGVRVADRGDDPVRPVGQGALRHRAAGGLHRPGRGAGGAGCPADTDTKTGVVVREFWAPKGNEFPNGKHCVWAGDRILKEDDNPYGWLPYVMFRGTPVPGKVLADVLHRAGHQPADRAQQDPEPDRRERQPHRQPAARAVPAVQRRMGRPPRLEDPLR
jgi:hypothetical protein